MVTQERVPGTVAGGRWSGRGAFLGMPLLAVVLLVGCSGGSGDPGGSSTSVSSSVSSARSSPSSTSSTTTSSSSSSAAYVPVKPTFPAAAKKHTPEGAEAFVRYYLELSAYAWSKPESGDLEPLADSSCGSCDYLETKAVELIKARERFASGVISVGEVRHVVTADKTIVVVVIDQLRSDRVNGLGHVTFAQLAEPGVQRSVVLEWRSSGWTVLAIGE